MNDTTSQYEQTLAAINVGQSGSGLEQFISFRVGDEDYATDILAVREIKGWSATTILPNQPPYVLGVMNLRGAIVPVFDLRCRFGRGHTNPGAKHVVVIVSVKARLIGLLVDTVSDILSVPPSAIGPIPDMDRATEPYLRGIITVNDAMVVLLDLETLFDTVRHIGQDDHASAA